MPIPEAKARAAQGADFKIATIDSTFCDWPLIYVMKLGIPVVNSEVAPDRLNDAARLLFEEALSLDTQIKKLEGELIALKEQRVRILQSLRPVRLALSENLAAEVGKLLEADPELLNDLPLRSERVRLLLTRILSDPMKAWSAEEAQSELKKSGENVTEKYTANTLRRLFEEGFLVRVSRGLYRASDQLVAIEGLVGDDY